MTQFLKDMASIDASSTDKESLVQQVYDRYLSSAFGPTQRQNKCDAFYSRNVKTEQKEDTVRLLCEYKYNLNFHDRAVLAKVIVQVVSYLRKFQKTTIAPSTILIGDLNEVVIFHSNWLIKYTNFPGVDWKVPASSLAASYPDLLKAILEDEAFDTVFTDVIKFSDLKDFDFNKEIVQKIIDLTLNIVRKIAVNSGNIYRFAEYFKEKVIADAEFKLDSKKMAAALYQTIIGEVSEVISTQSKSKDKDKKYVRFGNTTDKVLVYSTAFDNLMNSLEREYSREELKDLTGVFDRLIEDTQRRRDGKFYTPARLCEAARAYADKYLGEDWRTRGIVWDNSCGTCNLTKGVYFRELYVSTLDQEELDAAELSHSIDHRFTTAFQYDFLNDPYEKLPEKLRLAIENGVELTFFCNPPYGTAGAGANKGVNKVNANDTLINNSIEEEFRLEDLLSQFIYRMIKDFTSKTKVNIIFFGNTTWSSGIKAKRFRSFVCTQMKFLGGFLCNSKEFSGNADEWPIALSIITKSNNTLPNILEYDIFNSDKKYILFEPENDKLGKYAEENGSERISNYPSTSDALTANEVNSNPRNFTFNGSIGFLANSNNHRLKSSLESAIWSMPYSNGHGLDIYPSNFMKCCEIFTARQLSAQYTWLTAKEQYHIPDFNNPEYPIFSAASLVFSIFHSQAKSTSVELDYKGNHFVIKNHFFWLTKLEFQKQVMDLEPLQGEPDETPYMVTALNDMVQSLEANEHLTDEGINIVNQGLDIINQATELLKESYPYREDFAVTNPKFQLQHWDAGYKQLNHFWEDLSKNNAEFKVKYDKFKNDFEAFKKVIKPMVWKFGFLKGEPEE